MTHTSASAHTSEMATAVVAPSSPTCASGRDSATTKDVGDRDFRSTLGRFATGVTVVTALSADGESIGVTISSFNSVSLEPPLILWSLSLSSPNLETFRNASHYAVNVLSIDQQEISDRFASRSNKSFAGIPQHTGLGGAPLIEGCCACFECANEAHYPGGDHLIFVGRVERFAESQAESPLIFHNGRYCQLDSGKAVD
jgi:flavin reductase (DIM6/NTAB) family NADH-FMN oxidoreductase RutF